MQKHNPEHSSPSIPQRILLTLTASVFFALLFCGIAPVYAADFKLSLEEGSARESADLKKKPTPPVKEAAKKPAKESSKQKEKDKSIQTKASKDKKSETKAAASAPIESQKESEAPAEKTTAQKAPEIQEPQEARADSKSEAPASETVDTSISNEGIPQPSFQALPSMDENLAKASAENPEKNSEEIQAKKDPNHPSTHPAQSFLEHREDSESASRPKDFLSRSLVANGPSNLRIIVSVVFVLSLISVLGLWFQKKAGSRKRSRDLDEGETVRVVQNLRVGPKKNLIVVDFYGTSLLVGMTENQMQLVYAPPPARENTDRAPEVSETEARLPALDSVVIPKQPESFSEPPAPIQPQALSDKIRSHMKGLKPLGNDKRVH